MKQLNKRPEEEHTSPATMRHPTTDAMVQFYRQLSNASIDCVVALDMELNIIFWNDTCCSYSGFEAATVEGKPLSGLYPAFTENDDYVTALNMALKGHKVLLPTMRNAWLEGYFETHLVPLKDDTGEVNGVMLIAHDVAHRVKAEQELNQLNQLLAKQNRALERTNDELSTFTNITGRDLKEPLRKIYMMLEQLSVDEGPQFSGKGKATLRKTQAAAQRLSLMADSLVTFSGLRPEAVRMPVSLQDAVRSAISLLPPSLAVFTAGIDVKELPVVRGSSAQLRTLFLQLLSNALKFQPEGNTPYVTIKAETERGFNKISLTDNGIGIPAEELTQVLQLFEKGSNAGKHAGIGIGLNVARKIAENHEGFISLESAAGKGTTVYIFLPAM